MQKQRQIRITVLPRTVSGWLMLVEFMFGQRIKILNRRATWPSAKEQETFTVLHIPIVNVL